MQGGKDLTSERNRGESTGMVSGVAVGSQYFFLTTDY